MSPKAIQVNISGYFDIVCFGAQTNLYVKWKHLQIVYKSVRRLELQTECTQCGTIISNWYSKCEECERTTIPDGDADNSAADETNTD